MSSISTDKRGIKVETQQHEDQRHTDGSSPEDYTLDKQTSVNGSDSHNTSHLVTEMNRVYSFAQTGPHYQEE